MASHRPAGDPDDRVGKRRHPSAHGVDRGGIGSGVPLERGKPGTFPGEFFGESRSGLADRQQVVVGGLRIAA